MCASHAMQRRAPFGPFRKCGKAGSDAAVLNYASNNMKTGFGLRSCNTPASSTIAEAGECAARANCANARCTFPSTCQGNHALETAAGQAIPAAGCARNWLLPTWKCVHKTAIVRKSWFPARGPGMESRIDTRHLSANNADLLSAWLSLGCGVSQHLWARERRDRCCVGIPSMASHVQVQFELHSTGQKTMAFRNVSSAPAAAMVSLRLLVVSLRFTAQEVAVIAQLTKTCLTWPQNDLRCWVPTTSVTLKYELNSWWTKWIFFIPCLNDCYNYSALQQHKGHSLRVKRCRAAHSQQDGAGLALIVTKFNRRSGSKSDREPYKRC